MLTEAQRRAGDADLAQRRWMRDAALGLIDGARQRDDLLAALVTLADALECERQRANELLHQVGEQSPSTGPYTCEGST